jgi:hypothetical protein
MLAYWRVKDFQDLKCFKIGRNSHFFVRSKRLFSIFAVLYWSVQGGIGEKPEVLQAAVPPKTLINAKNWPNTCSTDT